jgi:hypothetical protein
MSSSARFGLVILAAVLAGCSGATPTPAPNASDHATPAGVAPSPTSSAPTQTQPEPTPTVPAPTPSATTATAAPAAETLPPYGVAIAIQDDVVIRSKPGVGADSEIYKPSLSRGDQVLVVGGPVRASGYDWYDVRPLAARLPSSGWVAQASKAGEPWIAPGRATCPPVPTTFATLAALTDGQQLACFSRVPITVSARLWRFVGSVDPRLQLGARLVRHDGLRARRSDGRSARRHCHETVLPRARPGRHAPEPASSWQGRRGDRDVRPSSSLWLHGDARVAAGGSPGPLPIPVRRRLDEVATRPPSLGTAHHDGRCHRRYDEPERDADPDEELEPTRLRVERLFVALDRVKPPPDADRAIGRDRGLPPVGAEQ